VIGLLLLWRTARTSRLCRGCGALKAISGKAGAQSVGADMHAHPHPPPPGTLTPQHRTRVTQHGAKIDTGTCSVPTVGVTTVGYDRSSTKRLPYTLRGRVAERRLQDIRGQTNMLLLAGRQAARYAVPTNRSHPDVPDFLADLADFSAMGTIVDAVSRRAMRRRRGDQRHASSSFAKARGGRSNLS